MISVKQSGLHPARIPINDPEVFFRDFALSISMVREYGTLGFPYEPCLHTLDCGCGY